MPRARQPDGTPGRAAAPQAAAPAAAVPAAHALQRGAGNRAMVSALRLDRVVEVRDVGRGERSGFHRLPELIDRLNEVSPSLLFRVEGRNLVYEQVGGLLANSFDRQMMALIDQARILPMRLTNRQGLLGDHVSGFHDPVDGDAFVSGYVDIDDLLAGDDLGFQMLLVHFLTERAATSNYARRIGITTGPGAFTNAEFNRGHRLGIEAEAEILRDFFGDATIRIVADSPSAGVRRVFRNARGDRFRRLIRRGTGAERGIHASRVDVVTPDGVRHTPEDYLALRAAEAGAAAAP
ncbi:MAG TPA: hypothetical protein VM266_09950 [Solirubrobacteraceae bacterium]|nr:hypothetical protein [Solirubrobacteraceae bacterium]